MEMPDNFHHFLELMLPQHNIVGISYLLLALTAMLLSGFIFYFVVKSYVIPSVHKVLSYFKPDLINAIKVPLLRASNRVSLMGPLLFYLTTFSWFLPEQVPLLLIMYNVVFAYLYINMGLFLNAMLNIGCIVYNKQSYAKDVPIKGIIQIAQLAVFLIFGGLAISALINKSPFFLLSGLGAITAVLLLVFKDTIMGLVAGIQIATNRMVAHGDWIEMPNYGADGDVLEVGLHTVKVQNFDKTITTIPTYKLISESFKNWRGMNDSGGRRIKRAFLIDVRSITFVDDEKLESLLEQVNNPGFSDVLKSKGSEQTNMGLFRQYCEFYVKNHEMVNQQMTYMARQLPPSEFGVPLEIYCFSRDKDWTAYERIQAGIIEHLLARLSDFGLKAYQRPADREQFC